MLPYACQLILIESDYKGCVVSIKQKLVVRVNNFYRGDAPLYFDSSCVLCIRGKTVVRVRLLFQYVPVTTIQTTPAKKERRPRSKLRTS